MAFYHLENMDGVFWGCEFNLRLELVWTRIPNILGSSSDTLSNHN